MVGSRLSRQGRLKTQPTALHEILRRPDGCQNRNNTRILGVSRWTAVVRHTSLKHVRCMSTRRAAAGFTASTQSLMRVQSFELLHGRQDTKP